MSNGVPLALSLVFTSTAIWAQAISTAQINRAVGDQTELPVAGGEG